MEAKYVDIGGDAIPAEAHRLPRAREVISHLSAIPPIPFMRFLESRRLEAGGIYKEAVFAELEVAVGQRPLNDIRRTERVALVFSEGDRFQPEALALRSDFPHVPHLNVGLAEYPKSLCLSDQPWNEVKLRWTARGFVEGVRKWLALTAQGRLHQHDQPLEPLLFGAETRILLPSDLFGGGPGTKEQLYVYAVGYEGRLTSLVARREPPTAEEAGTPLRFVALAVVSAPHAHGVIRWQPRNLKELHEFLLPVGTDLLRELRGQFKLWEAKSDLMGSQLILLVSLPKEREHGKGIEAWETWGFMTGSTLQDVGKAIGIWGVLNGHRGVLLEAMPEEQGSEIGLNLLRPHFLLSRSDASRLNGLANRFGGNIAAVGAGALGSQVFDTLVREGFGEWTLIDSDVLLPHNLSRHQLDGAAAGFPKAVALAQVANGILDGPPACVPLITNVLDPGDAANEVAAKFTEAELILDMSASVAVARHLSREVESDARRVSAFLNPSGSDLIVLAEDAERKVRLDTLEMQYYRRIAAAPDMAGHLRPDDGRVRYGHSCRDVSSRISQELVSLHSSIASRAVRLTVANPAASITVWRADGMMGVDRTEVDVLSVREVQSGSWTLSVDAGTLDKVKCLRQEKLPRETGGILIGSFDMERKIVYVIDTVPSPPDSEEQPTVYIRGCQGLRAEVDRIHEVTAGWLEYVGEWHSHPPGHSAEWSGDDKKLFGWLCEMMATDGYPAVMLIAGDGEDFRWHLK